jgi:NAD(P)-dependent dehydrogenase (short-subunit alcohol dehydrogenase family)
MFPDSPSDTVRINKERGDPHDPVPHNREQLFSSSEIRQMTETSARTNGGMKIAGSVALVTGGNRGLGKAFVRGLLDAGAAKVYAAARDASSVTDGGATPVGLDIRDEREVAAAADACRDVTLLINNAGVAGFTPLIGAPSMDAARGEIAVNYLGTLAMCRAFAPILAANGGGAIVNILSVVSWITLPASGSYSVSKAAELAMTNGIRVELRARNTLVVAVHAGYIDTAMTAGLAIEKTTPEAVVSATLAALERGETEVLADDRSQDVKHRLRNDPASLEREMQSNWDNYLARQANPSSAD